MKLIRERIKQQLRKSPDLFDRARRGHELITGKVHPVSNLLDELTSSCSSEVCCIQLGASDGITNDPYRRNIVDKKWNAVLIEPDSSSYKSLGQSYKTQIASGSVRLVNAAISSLESQTKLKLHRFSEQYISRLHDGSAIHLYQKTSFDPDHLKKFGFLQGRCDVLIMDLEGYEHEVIQNLNFDSLRPRVIVFENEHLAPSQLQDVEQSLKRHGYNIRTIEKDCVAFLPPAGSNKVRKTQ